MIGDYEVLSKDVIFGGATAGFWHQKAVFNFIAEWLLSTSSWELSSNYSTFKSLLLLRLSASPFWVVHWFGFRVIPISWHRDCQQAELLATPRESWKTTWGVAGRKREWAVQICHVGGRVWFREEGVVVIIVFRVGGGGWVIEVCMG